MRPKIEKVPGFAMLCIVQNTTPNQMVAGARNIEFLKLELSLLFSYERTV